MGIGMTSATTISWDTETVSAQWGNFNVNSYTGPNSAEMEIEFDVDCIAEIKEQPVEPVKPEPKDPFSVEDVEKLLKDYI